MTKNLLALAAAALLSGTAWAADAPITAVTCSAGVTGCSYAIDGIFPEDHQSWTDQTAWWQGMGDSVTFTLGGSYQISGLTVGLDNNDGYRIEASTDGLSWALLVDVPAGAGDVGWGMDTFSTDPMHPEFDAGLVWAPHWASQVRITAFEGDSYNSVGELVLTATAVPEPATSALFLSGVLALASMVRRRRC